LVVGWREKGGRKCDEGGGVVEEEEVEMGIT